MTQLEIEKALLNPGSNKDNVLFFIRNIKNLEPVLKNSEEIKMKQRFIDLSGQEVDLEAKKLLNRLKDKIKKNSLPQNLHELTVSFLFK